MIRAVTRAVQQRLGDAGPDVVELVVREVASAMATQTDDVSSSAMSASGVAHESTVGAPMVDNADGTVTTGLGSVLPRPKGELSLSTCASCVEQVRRREGGPRAILTATGLNQRGVIHTANAVIDSLHLQQDKRVTNVL